MNFPGLDDELKKPGITHILLVFTSEGCDRSIGCGLNGVGFSAKGLTSEELVEYLLVPGGLNTPKGPGYGRYDAPFTLFGPGSIKSAFIIDVSRVNEISRDDIIAHHNGNLSSKARDEELRKIRHKLYLTLKKEFGNESTT